jgi:thioester reductase-like protein
MTVSVAAMPRPLRDVRQRTVLITGASGVLGRALLPVLSDARVICLVHRAPLNVAKVMCLQGDVSTRWLGLSRAAFDELAAQIDCIIHSAAVTQFRVPAEETRRVNVDGTRHVIELAHRAQAPLYHVSTAFVGTQSRSEQPPTAYELSKLESDAVLRESGVPHVVLRPSLVIGDSVTGRIAQFQGIYLVLGLYLKGLLPVVPALPDTYADFIPQDVVANAVATLIRNDVRRGEYWLTLGDQALTIGEVVELCAALAEEIDGLPRLPVRLVAPDTFERLIKPAFLPVFPDRARRLLERASELTRYMNLEQRFPSSLSALHRQFGMPPLPDPRSSLMRSLAHWAESTGFSVGPSARARLFSDGVAA